MFCSDLQAYTGPSTSCELRSLRPATYYYLKVQAINAAGPGDFSDVTSCTSPSSSPEVVPSLRVISSTSDSLLLKWTEPNNCGEEILAYNIDIGKDQTIVVEGNVTEYCIDQLEADSKYRYVKHDVTGCGSTFCVVMLRFAASHPFAPFWPENLILLQSKQDLSMWLHLFNLENNIVTSCIL